jgi:hypothetical protein
MMNEKELAWLKSGKGRGHRWLILRDLVALLAIKAMSIMMIQDCMLKLRGLTRRKVVELMDDLERARAIKQVSGDVNGVVLHGWAATENGVSYWLGSRTAIPAHIARVASTIQYAVPLEA